MRNLNPIYEAKITMGLVNNALTNAKAGVAASAANGNAANIIKNGQNFLNARNVANELKTKFSPARSELATAIRANRASDPLRQAALAKQNKAIADHAAKNAETLKAREMMKKTGVATDENQIKEMLPTQQFVMPKSKLASPTSQVAKGMEQFARQSDPTTRAGIEQIRNANPTAFKGVSAAPSAPSTASATPKKSGGIMGWLRKNW